MTFLWATPAGAGTAPPSQMPNMPSGPSESTEAERRVHQGGNCQKSSSASMAFMVFFADSTALIRCLHCEARYVGAFCAALPGYFSWDKVEARKHQARHHGEPL